MSEAKASSNDAANRPPRPCAIHFGSRRPGAGQAAQRHRAIGRDDCGKVQQILQDEHLGNSAIRHRFIRPTGVTLSTRVTRWLRKARLTRRRHCPILITGHPRSGTGSAAALCRQFGLDVRHEEVGEDGIASWMMAVDDWNIPYHDGELARSRY